MAEFTWNPDYGASADRMPRIKSARFGDGYEQRNQDGLNAIAEVWQLTFAARTTTEADEIDTFLKARGAVESFDWTPPRSSTAGKYICRQWSRTATNGIYDTISARFEQVFDL